MLAHTGFIAQGRALKAQSLSASTNTVLRLVEGGGRRFLDIKTKYKVS